MSHQRWTRRSTGLYVPNGIEAEQLPPVEPRLEERLLRRREIWFHGLTATATVVALIFSSLSVRIAADASAQQASINQWEVDRYDRRHASRVSYWDDYGNDQVTVRNMSPATLGPVEIEGTWLWSDGTHVTQQNIGDRRGRDIYALGIHLNYMPPCHEITVRITNGEVRDALWRLAQREGNTGLTKSQIGEALLPFWIWRSRSMSFWLGGDEWRLDSYGRLDVYNDVLMSEESKYKPDLTLGVGEIVRRETVDDCGEG